MLSIKKIHNVAESDAVQQDVAFEAQLQTTLNLIPAHVWYAVSSGALIFVSERIADYLGLPQDHALRFGIDTGAAWDSHVLFLHPDDREETRRIWSTCLRTGSAGEASFRVRNAAGEYRWFLSRAEPFRASDGTLLYWVGVNLDIEERKQAEFYLAEGQRLAHTGSWSFSASGFDFWSSELFRIHGLDPGGKPPTLGEYLDLVHTEDRGFMKQAIEKMLADHRGFDFTKRIVRPDGKIRHIRCVGVPATRGETFLGFVGTGIDVTEQEQEIEGRRRSEAYLAEAQRLSHTGSFGWKPRTGEIVWSDETYRIFEWYRTKEPTLDEIVQSVHPDDRPPVQDVIRRASETGMDFEHECRLLTPSGKIKHIHARAKGVRDSRGDIEFIGALTDITERKRAEEKIGEHEQKVRSTQAYLVEAQRLSKTGSFAWSTTKDNTYYSDECCRLLGFEPSGTPPPLETVIQRIHPDDQQYCREVVARCIQAKVDVEFDYRIIHPDKSVRNIHCVSHPVLDRDGNLDEFIGTVIDVTARKQADEQLKAQDMELRQVLDLAPQLVAVFGPGRERIYANRMALDYLGISLDEWRQGKAGSELHPDDVQRLTSYADRAKVSGSAYEAELRLRKGDGTYRWFLARYNPLHDEKGQITRWYVASTDIDDRKKVEDRLQEENAALREEIDKASMFEEIVGTSSALKAVLSHISKVAPSDSTVLITGETGTGKELVARAIHRRSARATRPFVSVNCAAIPRDLIASELFGHEKGAFTGATQRRVGRFELADGGTIFLDEVGELLPDTQAALLRVLQEREFERVGGTQAIHVNVRIIAATNRKLEEAVASGDFRTDLFYRLNVFPLEVPSLRERKDDILMLVEYFVQRYARKGGKRIRSIDKKTLDLLQSYQWPGNIRELQNVIERSVILSSGEVLSVDEWWLSRTATGASSRVEAQPIAKGEIEPRSEREIIEAALLKTRGRVSGTSGAAARLGVPPSTLEHRIRALKIDKKQFKFR